MSRPPPSQPSAAARPRAPSSDWRPWSQAWIERLQAEPAWAGLAFAVAHVLVGSSLYFTLAGDRTRPERVWPFDMGTLGRFALYAAIGLGSWFGGAIVERLLDVAIG